MRNRKFDLALKCVRLLDKLIQLVDKLIALWDMVSNYTSHESFEMEIQILVQGK